MIPHNATSASAQPELIAAQEAFEAFAALRRAARSEPHLIGNRYFCALQDTAYARFRAAYDAMEVRP